MSDLSFEPRTAAIIEAEVEAQLHAQWLAEAEARDYGFWQERADKNLAVMREASATITRCAERMKTGKPSARFAYAAHITKAKRKFGWAIDDLRRYS